MYLWKARDQPLMSSKKLEHEENVAEGNTILMSCVFSNTKRNIP